MKRPVTEEEIRTARAELEDWGKLDRANALGIPVLPRASNA